MLLKLSSVKIISEASFATSVPAIPCFNYKVMEFNSSPNLSLKEFCSPVYANLFDIWSLTMAKPTSAFFRAGPSLVPSPVTATTSRLEVTLLLMIPLTRVYLSIG